MVLIKKQPILASLFRHPTIFVKKTSWEAHFDYSFDLIHARYVLIHNKNDQDMIRKIHSLLKPGGYAVLEEPDFSSAKFLNDASDISHQKVNSANNKMFVDLGLDPAYGIRLPQKLNAAGFHIVEAPSTIHLCEGKLTICQADGRICPISDRQISGDRRSYRGGHSTLCAKRS